jgi:hypothetical protein
MNSIEEKLYCYIILECEKCGEIYEPDVAATNPMPEWASRNAELAISQGWNISQSGENICHNCSKEN